MSPLAQASTLRLATAALGSETRLSPAVPVSCHKPTTLTGQPAYRALSVASLSRWGLQGGEIAKDFLLPAGDEPPPVIERCGIVAQRVPKPFRHRMHRPASVARIELQ